MRKFAALLLVALCACASSAHAGLYTDDMSRCLVESSTPEDKAALVRWIFVALSQNPAISSLSKATAEDIERSNAAVGALFMRLLTVACAEKTKKAIQYEGPAATQASFEVLGRVASAGLFADPKVQAVIAGIEKHVDRKKLDELKSSPQ